MYTRRMACTEIDRQTSRQTDRQTDRQTNRQTDKQTDRQTNRQTIFLYLIHLYYILPLYTTLHPVSMRVTAYLHIRVHPITYHNVLPQILMCYSLFIYMLWLFPHVSTLQPPSRSIDIKLISLQNTLNQLQTKEKWDTVWHEGGLSQNVTPGVHPSLPSFPRLF